MPRKALFVTVGLAVMLLIGAGTVMAQQGDPAKGKDTWAAKLCKNCHGDNGEGRLAGPLAGTQRTVQEAITQVRTPRAQMPAFKPTQVSDQEIADMVAFLKTLQRPASFTPIASIAKEGDPAGKLLFAQKRCQGCHGDGAGLVQNRFTNQGRTVTAADVIKQLRTPAQNMPMFSPAQVSDADAGQIATYLASLAAPAKAAAPAAPAPAPAKAPAALPASGEAPLDYGPWAGQLLLAGIALLMLGVGFRLLGRTRA